MVLPNAFLLGAEKCGTTSLTNWLNQHREVCVVKNKETIYFNTNQYAKGDQWYSVNYFGHYHGEKIIMDNNAMNLLIPFVPPRIFKSCFHLNPKFVILVREPMKRAYSHWWMHHTKFSPGYARETFEDALAYNSSNFSYEKFKYEFDRMNSFDGINGSYIPTYIEQGLYHHNLMRYVKLFGESNIKIIFTDDMARNPKLVYQDLIEFLNIDNYFDPEFTNLNETKIKYDKGTNINKLWECNSIIKSIAKRFFKQDAIRLSQFCRRNLISEWEYDKL